MTHPAGTGRPLTEADIDAFLAQRHQPAPPPPADPPRDDHGDGDGDGAETHIHMMIELPDGVTRSAGVTFPGTPSCDVAADLVANCTWALLAQLGIPLVHVKPPRSP